MWFWSWSSVYLLQSPAARYRVAACSTTLSQDIEKVSTVLGLIWTPIFSVSAIWEKEFLVPSKASSVADAFGILFCLVRNDTLDEIPQKTKQKVAAGLFFDKLRQQDFGASRSSRSSKVHGPISRCRVYETLFHIKLVTGASRPGQTVGSVASCLCALHRDFTLKTCSCMLCWVSEWTWLTLTLEWVSSLVQFFYKSSWTHATLLPQKSFSSWLDHPAVW